MTPEEQSAALKALNEKWFPDNPLKGAAGIAQVTEVLAAWMVEQERIIKNYFASAANNASHTPLVFAGLHAALQYRIYSTINRIDWHLSEITGEFHTSFKEDLFAPCEAPKTVEEVQ